MSPDTAGSPERSAGRLRRFLRSHADETFAVGTTAVVLLLFILWKRHDLRPQPSDENIYFYLARRVAEGQVPYRDFFFAHAPFQLYVFAALHKLFGFHLVLFKSTALVATCVAAGFVAATARQVVRSVAAPVAAILFLFSSNTWTCSSLNFGTELGVMFCAAGFYFFSTRRLAVAGTMIGLALLTTVQVIAVPLALCAALLWKDRPGLVRFGGAALAVFGLVTLVFVLLTGVGPMYTQIFGYHVAKVAMPFDERLGRFLEELRGNVVVVVAAALAPFGRLADAQSQQRPEEGERQRFCLVAGAAAVGAHLLILGFARTIFRHYFTLALVFLAVIGARTLSGGLGRRLRIAAVAALLLLALRGVTWQERRTTRDSASLRGAGKVAEYVKANSEPDEEIFGDDLVTPLVALMADRRIALDQADTNPTTFDSGAIRLEELLERLGRRGPRFLIFHEWGSVSTIWNFEAMRKFTRESCPPGTVSDFVEFPDEGDQVIRVYSCFPLPPG